jgi:nicotinamidase-related amidase
MTGEPGNWSRRRQRRGIAKPHSNRRALPAGAHLASIAGMNDWSDFALLIVDVQKGFWGDWLARHMPEFPAKTAALLDLCRREGIAVVHVRLSFRRDGGDWPPFEKLGEPINCLEDSSEREPTDFARDLPGEAVIYKHALDGFVGPELHAHLAAAGKKFVLVSGLITSVCVLLTAVSATQRGYLTAIVEDCCADDSEPHRFALAHFDRFGFVRTRLDAIVGELPRWRGWLDQLAAKGHRVA